MDWEQKFSRGFHVEDLKYYYSQEHTLMGLGEGIETKFDNIGKNGCNLTVAVLSMNRSNLTIRLMESIKEFIPEFAGEFLIGDNGSVEEEKNNLYQAMKRMPFRCRMIEFGQNYGVAGGRNRLFKEVETDWLLSADNDLYFIGNPLSKIKHDISVLGCHFIGLPILNKEGYGTGIYGGHIYVENIRNKVSIGGGSVLISQNVETNVDNPPFLCTFLPGGACIMKKQTFFECGAFDDGMFVGFEDVEFSLRLYQRGLKIGACGMASIIHDHPKPEKSADKSYEKKRFSSSKISESGKYFEKKHGFSVWNPETEKWVKGRLNQLLSQENTDDEIPDGRKKIALVVDARSWALDHIADQIIEKISEYEFKRIYLSDVENIAQVLMLAEDCSIVHFLWRPLVSTYYEAYVQKYIASMGMDSEAFYERYIRNKYISVSVYDHLLLDGEDAEITRKLFSDEKTIVNGYAVSSLKLRNLYNKTEWIYKKPLAVTQDGVDTKHFYPMNLERFKKFGNRTIKIGWAGNSKWVIGDLKGINTIIKPAIEILQMQGYDVELVTTDRNQKKIPFEEMPKFYSEIDIYVCASMHEGTPNPVLEAMACGIPVVSTDVGIVSEVFGRKQKEFILEERSVHCLVKTLKRLLDQPDLFKQLSDENLESIMPWDWSIMVQNFNNYFRELLRHTSE